MKVLWSFFLPVGEFRWEECVETPPCQGQVPRHNRTGFAFPFTNLHSNEITISLFHEQQKNTTPNLAQECPKRMYPAARSRIFTSFSGAEGAEGAAWQQSDVRLPQSSLHLRNPRGLPLRGLVGKVKLGGVSQKAMPLQKGNPPATRQPWDASCLTPTKEALLQAHDADADAGQL